MEDFTRLLARYLVLPLLVSSSAALAMELEVISKPVTGGATGNLNSSTPDIDGSGEVIAFSSFANDLVSGDSGPLSDIFVYTDQTGGLANVTSGGNGNSGLPRISSDGRFVAFVSNATNLASPDTNGGNPNVFVLDRQTETLSIGPELANYPLDAFDFSNRVGRQYVAISADGELVALISSAASLQPQNTVLYQKLFLWKPATNEVTGVRLDADFGISEFDLSDDGRFVIFTSSARNILEEPLADHGTRLYLYNVTEDSVELLADIADASRPTISADGRHVTYLSNAHNVGQLGMPNFGSSLFTLDTQTNQTLLVDKDFSGANPVVNPNATSGTRYGAISSDGNRIAFLSSQRYLVPNDNNGAADIFLWDRTTGQTSRLTPGADRGSSFPSLTANGDAVVFASAATNLLDVADNNGFYDVFAWREDTTTEPECALRPSGVLSSSSGVSVNLQGTTTCFGEGLYSYGTSDSAGISIPAARGRAALQLVPENEPGLPANDLVFFTYPSTDGQRLYATNFVARDSGYNVQMTFKSSSPDTFALYELVVFEPNQLSRRRVVYREQDTQWTFTPQTVGTVLNLSVSLFADDDDDNLRSDDDRPYTGINARLFKCGGEDGIAGTERSDLSGILRFATLEPGYYQLAVDLYSSIRFSSLTYDDSGNVLNTITVAVNTDSGSTGYSACTDFTNGANSFKPIGILRR